MIFGGPEDPLSNFHDRRESAGSIFRRATTCRRLADPRAGENGGTAMSLAVQKLSLSNRFYVSEWLGSPCPIPQPV